MKKILFLITTLLSLNTVFAQNDRYRVPDYYGVNLRPFDTTTINALTGAREGDIRFNTLTKELWYYNGSAWEAVGNQSLSLSGTGNKDLTISGTNGNTIDLTGVDGIDPDNIVSDITGVTGGTQYTNVYGQTEAGQIADGTPPAGTLSICTNCYPYIEVALSDYTTNLTTGTSKAYWRAPFAMEVMDVRASVLTAPTGANIIVDINESGTSIMTTNKLSIDATEKTSTTAATAAGITDANIADDAEITFDIDQIGSTIAGAGLLVKIYYR